MLPNRPMPAGYEDEDGSSDDLELLVGTTQQLKIKVVPHITVGAGLNGEDFDCTMSVSMAKWFEEFKATYSKCKRTPATKQHLKMVLMKDPQPLKLALQLFATSPGCNYLKNKNIASYILETICDLYQQYPNIAETCDDNTRIVAFNFVKTCGIVPLYEAVTETYQLQKIQNYLIPKLQMLLQNNFYKDVAYWSIYLKCTNTFGILDLVFPLILQDKIYLAEEFLNVATEHQIPTVQFLDSLLDRKKTVYENCDEILKNYKCSEFKHSILSYRPMSKLVTRLVKKYKIDSKYTPNLKYCKSCSYLHYLFYKYEDGGMSLESWRELAREEANKSKDIQLDLIATITSVGNMDEALFWAQLYKIPAEECPLALRSKLEAGNQANAASDAAKDSPNCKSGMDKDEFLTLDLPQKSIILVDTMSKFLDMLQYLEQFRLLGFDSEWKPSVHNEDRVSLIQLATVDRVYLVDCLSPLLDAGTWRLMGSRIFNNLEIMKLGFSMNHDFQMLHKSLPLQLNLQATSCYLDLQDLWRRLKYMEISNFPYKQTSIVGESLCALTELCLGKKLDKSNQCSNWANRPLRQDQITYAALDAHCLLQIYQVLADLLLRHGIYIESLVEEITTSKTGYLFRTKSKLNATRGVTGAGNLSQRVNHKQETKRHTAPFKFLCDFMLGALSKELRKLGFDCLEINENNFDFAHYIELARVDQRIILAQNSRYMMFAGELNKEQCIQIPAGTTEDQLLHILQYFKLKIEAQQLNSRCVGCNGTDFILANRFQMQIICFGNLQQVDDGSLKNIRRKNKFCTISTINDHIIRTRKTFSGKTIKIRSIKSHQLYNQDYFFICDHCGICICEDTTKLPAAENALINLPSKETSASAPAPWQGPEN